MSRPWTTQEEKLLIEEFVHQRDTQGWEWGNGTTNWQQIALKLDRSLPALKSKVGHLKRSGRISHE